METPAVISRVADLIRNPRSPMPSEWDQPHSKGSGASESLANSQPKTAKSVKIEPPEVNAKVQNSNEEGTQTLISGDKLTLSPLAQRMLDEESQGGSEWEKSRSERVQRIQQLVQDRQYTMSPEVVNGIAQKIVAMLP